MKQQTLYRVTVDRTGGEAQLVKEIQTGRKNNLVYSVWLKNPTTGYATPIIERVNEKSAMITFDKFINAVT